MFRKGQAAMEFLMTYGWAILVVLAAIGALAYFGVLSPDRFLPEKCQMPAGIACTGYTGTTTAVQVRMQNAGGFDMDSIVVNITNSAGASVICTDSGGDSVLQNGEADTFTCTSAFTAGKLKTSLDISYTNRQTTLNHSKKGELILKI